MNIDLKLSATALNVHEHSFKSKLRRQSFRIDLNKYVGHDHTAIRSSSNDINAVKIRDKNFTAVWLVVDKIAEQNKLINIHFN